MVYALLRPFLKQLDAEDAHRLAILSLKAWPLGGSARADGALATTVAGLSFPNPLGIAAGFDKDAEVPDALLGVGFGFAEVGSITPLPQSGNPRPRLFRLEEDRGVINRMGFNNGGAEAAVARLARRARRPGIVGINIGANKDSPDRVGEQYLSEFSVDRAPRWSELRVKLISRSVASLFISLLSFVMAGCSVPLEKLYGTYVASYPFGTETITLHRDGSFIQHVVVNGKSATA